MAARNEAKDALPTSHFFITVARGRSTRTFVARSGVAFFTTAALPLLLLWFLGSTFFLVFHDDLVASLMLRQRDMQYGYEDRIASLRSQLDRETTRQLVAQRSIETKLDELTVREADLQKRSGVIARLDGQAARMVGLSGVSPAAVRGPAPSLTPDGLSGLSVAAQTPHDREAPAKPRPEAAIFPTDPSGDQAPRASLPLTERLSSLSGGLDAIAASQDGQLDSLNLRVRKTVARYHDALATAGLTEDRLDAQRPGSGGPFVPLTREDDGSPFARAAVGLQLTISQAEQLSAAIAHVPFDKPLDGDPEITSPFGARVDPFLGRPAMHTGVDLSDDTGTQVRSTAPGRVTVAGPASGYGTMVEIDHGAGLTTRYAHLSEAKVAVGETVRAAQLIGLVGATGRATGPHLHYETRIDGDPVDPIRFMAAGQRLRSSGSGAL